MIWIFASVYVACEAYLYNKGHNTLFFAHKTPEEKQLRHNAVYGQDAILKGHNGT
jgi:hypothetical protein